MFDISTDFFPRFIRNSGRHKCDSCSRRFDHPKIERISKKKVASRCPYCHHTLKIITLKKGLVK